MRSARNAQFCALGGNCFRKSHYRLSAANKSDVRKHVSPLRLRIASRFYQRSSDVAENERVVILTGLVRNKSRIGSAHRSELVLSSIGNPGRQTEKEPLNSDDIHGID